MSFVAICSTIRTQADNACERHLAVEHNGGMGLTVCTQADIPAIRLAPRYNPYAGRQHLRVLHAVKEGVPGDLTIHTQADSACERHELTICTQADSTCEEPIPAMIAGIEDPDNPYAGRLAPARSTAPGHDSYAGR